MGFKPPPTEPLANNRNNKLKNPFNESKHRQQQIGNRKENTETVI